MPNVTMDEMRKEAAKSFVRVVLNNKTLWRTGAVLLPSEEGVLLQLVSLAGFEADGLVLTKFYRRLPSQNGEKRESVLVNGTCPYVVRNERCEVLPFATGWLNQLVRIIQNIESGMTLRADKVEIIAEHIVNEIEKSIPLDPILFDMRMGEYLGECPPVFPPSSDSGYMVPHVRDHTLLPAVSQIVGIHVGCGNGSETIRRFDAGAGNDAIMCENCGIKAEFPHSVRTYGELRKACNLLSDIGEIKKETEEQHK